MNFRSTTNYSSNSSNRNLRNSRKSESSGTVKKILKYKITSDILMGFHFMVSTEERTYIITFALILLILPIFTENTITQSESILPHSPQNQNNIINELTTDYENEITTFPSFSYNPIVGLTGSGDDIDIQDELSVYHSTSLNLTGSSENYTIEPILDFTAKELKYNMTINSKVNTINYEILENKDTEDLTMTKTMQAQKFAVDWDYVIFHSARMYLKPKLGGYGSDEMKLYIVKADVSGNPNTSVSYGNETNGPYSSSNPLPSSSEGSFAYFDFGDPVLERGTYFIVAEKIADDGNDATGFIWRSLQGSIYKNDALYFDGSWNVNGVTGLPVYEMDLGSEISLDPSLITGFLTAISSMGIELRGDRAGSVKRLQYKNFYVTGSESGLFTLYTFSEIELNEEIEQKLTVISDWFAKMFGSITETWDGSTEVFRDNLQGITEKIMKEIHLWIFYPFKVSPYKQFEIEEFNGLRKQLVNFIINGDNITISRIFDELDEVRIEKGLPIIFEFIELGILIPVFDAYKIATVRF